MEPRLFVNGEEIEIGYVPLIRNQHKMLCNYRDDGRVPSRILLEDIAVYEFILKHDCPEKAAEAYFREKEKCGDFTVPKIKIANQLGWEINLNGGRE